MTITENYMYKMLCVPTTRSSIIKLLERKLEAKDYEIKGFKCSKEVMEDELNILKSWKSLSKDQKKAFAKQKAIEESFTAGQTYGFTKKEELRAMPGKAVDKIKKVFKNEKF